MTDNHTIILYEDTISFLFIHLILLWDEPAKVKVQLHSTTKFRSLFIVKVNIGRSKFKLKRMKGFSVLKMARQREILETVHKVTAG